jgi:hypothetical protein
MVEGYSHELSSCGFWPGGGEEGAFYAYAYPEPGGFKDHPVQPTEAFYSDDAGQFLLPYEAVRTAPDPDAALLAFLQTTYEAAADRGGWDRNALEDDRSGARGHGERCGRVAAGMSGGPTTPTSRRARSGVVRLAGGTSPARAPFYADVLGGEVGARRSERRCSIRLQRTARSSA